MVSLLIQFCPLANPRWRLWPLSALWTSSSILNSRKPEVTADILRRRSTCIRFRRNTLTRSQPADLFRRKAFRLRRRRIRIISASATVWMTSPRVRIPPSPIQERFREKCPVIILSGRTKRKSKFRKNTRSRDRIDNIDGRDSHLLCLGVEEAVAFNNASNPALHYITL